VTPLYLESWLREIIAIQSARNEEFRRQTGIEQIPSLSRAAVEAYRGFHLRQTLRYAYEKSHFYRRQFDRIRLKPSDIRGFEDLHKLPLTEPEELAQNPYHFLCTSQSDVVRPCIFVTSGTTGPRKEIFWSRWDLDRITDFMAAGIATVASPRDTIQILLHDGRPDSQADLLRQGVEKLGATAVCSGAERSATEQLEILENSRSTVLFGYTGQIYRMTRELQQSGHDLRSKEVRVLFLAGEYLPAPRRRELETAWDCRVRTHYGLTEMGLGVAVECEAESGYHFNEADLLLEIVDPKSGRRIGPGEEGELAFTTLTRESMPLIRYRTHDLSRWVPEPCSCGAHGLLKFDAVKKRLEAIVKLPDGAEVYPALFDDLLFEIPGVVDYRVRIIRQGNKDRMDFQIEVARESEHVPDTIRRRLLDDPVIAGNLEAATMHPPHMEIVPMGTLLRIDRAKKMIVDER
jgi:phenylacetate-CoA ligase